MPLFINVPGRIQNRPTFRYLLSILTACLFTLPIRRLSLVICVMAIMVWPVQAEDSQKLSVHQAKAVLLYNLLKNTRWPNDDALTELKVQFYGQDNAFVHAFESIALQTQVREKKLQVGKHNLFPTAIDFQVLVLDQEHSRQIEDIAARLSRQGVLIVSDQAQDKKSVMFNFTRPESQRIAFEVNRSNIVYEGLSIAKEVLLYGGSEIEVAAMYKEMEHLLLNIKDEVALQREQLLKQQIQMREQEQRISEKELQFSQLQDELASKALALVQQQGKLLTVQADLVSNREKLLSARDQLEAKNLAVAELENNIGQQMDVLDELNRQITEQQNVLNMQSLMVSEQAQTIDTLRNVLLVALIVLLMITLYVIIRQKQAIHREKQLFEAKTALVSAQQESIRAYESSLQLKNDFLTAINHELRTPMNGIIGELQVVDNTNPLSMRGCLNSVSKSAEQMMTMVDDILCYIEIQSEQLAFHYRAVDTQSFFDDLLRHYHKRFLAKGSALQWHMDEQLPACLKIDDRQFLKALQKVLDNALKFGGTGKVAVSVSYQSDAKSPVLICTIDDNGPGLQPEELNYAFESFRQHDSGLKRRYNGLGIGLAICQKLMQGMGGKIHLANRPDGGCRAVLSLPATEASRPEQSDAQPPIADIDFETSQSAAGSQLILVVEDNEVNCKILQKMLHKLGHQSLLARDGVEALSLLEQSDPSLILMDLQMPIMDGFDCTRAIRCSNSKAATVPIIAVTANMMSQQRELCEKVGMNGFLDKPVSLARLNQTLKQFLSIDQTG